MIDFLNEHLENLNVSILNLYPIYVDGAIMSRHHDTFNSELLENLEDYYISKENLNILRYKVSKKPLVIKNNNYNDFDLFFKINNPDKKTMIVFGMDKYTNFIVVHFYSNFNSLKLIETVRMSGGIFLLSNFVNNGISVQLLDMLYQFLENNHFDDQNPFCKIYIN